MNSLATALPTVWWSIDLPGYRPHPSGFATYSAFEYDQLPPILESLNGDFAWLHRQPKQNNSINCNPDGESFNHKKIHTILDQITYSIPASFIHFMNESSLHAKIRSCTACYLDIADRSVRAKNPIDGTLIHFLSDQQWCLHWYLLIADNEEHGVVVSGEPFGYRFAPEEEYNNVYHQTEIILAENDIQLCAPSFEEFIYRFWIENEIWFNSEWKSEPLNTVQQAYLDHYTKYLS